MKGSCTVQEPLVSIIIPVYKVEAYLDHCVQSVVDQTWRNLEIILVDDGSPDTCGRMCDGWAEQDTRIKVIHKENGGLSDARNAGLAIAGGELIAFLDSDDFLDPEFIGMLYRHLTDRGADVAECATRLVDEAGNLLGCRGVTENRTVDKMEALRRLVLEDGVYQTVWNKLYRREVLEGILFEKGKYNEDDFWTYQVFDRMGKLALVSRPMYHYLQRGSSIMGNGYSLKRLDGLQARFLRMEYLQRYEELAGLARQEFVFDCMWHLQQVLRCLTGQDRAAAAKSIAAYLRQTAPVRPCELTVTAKYRLWLALFTRAPRATAWLRNCLRIGV